MITIVAVGYGRELISSDNSSNVSPRLSEVGDCTSSHPDPEWLDDAAMDRRFLVSDGYGAVPISEPP